MMFTSMPNGNLIRFELFRIDISADEVIDITNSIAASAREKEGGQSFSAGITDHL